MFRIMLALLIGGCVLAFFGIQEYRVSMGTSAEPELVDLHALETGAEISNNHVKVGEHVAVFGACVYEYEESSLGGMNDSSKVTHLYYPIISDEHDFFQAINRLAEKYGDPFDAPDAEWPDIDEFAVLVKTKRFSTIGSIPDGLQDEGEVQGLVVNRISSLDSEEKQLVNQSFPRLDLNKVLILEQDRHPASLAKSLGMIAGGMVMVLISIGSFFIGRGGGQPPATAQQFGAPDGPPPTAQRFGPPE